MLSVLMLGMVLPGLSKYGNFFRCSRKWYMSVIGKFDFCSKINGKIMLLSLEVNWFRWFKHFIHLGELE